jgi:hypothetical protein
MRNFFFSKAVLSCRFSQDINDSFIYSTDYFESIMTDDQNFAEDMGWSPLFICSRELKPSFKNVATHSPPLKKGH